MLDTLVNILAAGRFAVANENNSAAWHTFPIESPEAQAHVAVYRLHIETEATTARCWGIDPWWTGAAAVWMRVNVRYR